MRESLISNKLARSKICTFLGRASPYLSISKRKKKREQAPQHIRETNRESQVFFFDRSIIDMSVRQSESRTNGPSALVHTCYIHTCPHQGDQRQIVNSKQFNYPDLNTLEHPPHLIRHRFSCQPSRVDIGN